MPEKNFATRLNQTITFIEQTPPPLNFRGDKAVVVQALRTWNTQTALNARQTISGLMSQDGTTHRPGDKTLRKYRRAVILLRCAFMEPPERWQTVHNQTNAKSGAEGRAAYPTWLESARDAVYNRQNIATQELQNLIVQPELLLARWPLEVNGVPGAGKKTYRAKFDGGKLKLDCKEAIQSTLTTEAINIPVTPYIKVKDGLSNITPTSSEGEGCDVMLTTQFTGCTYCFQKRRGELLAAHIDPNATNSDKRLKEGSGGYAGEEVSTELRAHGGFSGIKRKGFHAYGRNVGGYGYGMVGRVIIVAVKKDDGWRVYAQLQYPDDTFTVERIDE